MLSPQIQGRERALPWLSTSTWHTEALGVRGPWCPDLPTWLPDQELRVALTTVGTQELGLEFLLRLAP